ncbi:MAG: hypothetical protein WKG00_15315 [Polyangiaceae bacterium]
MSIQARAALLALTGTMVAAGCGEAEEPAARAVASAMAAPSRAARHLPEGCEVVVHYSAGASRAAPSPGNAAVRALLPGGGDDELAMAQLRALGAFDPERDVDSALVCLSAGGLHQVMVAAGDIPLGALLPAIEADTPSVERRRVDDVEAVVLTVDERRWTLGQAADGAIVVADDDALFAGALRESTRAAELAMRFDAPLSVHAGQAVLERLGAPPPGGVVPAGGSPARGPFAAALAGATRLDMSGGAGACLRVDYDTVERASAAAPVLRDLVDRRVDESTRVRARVEGSRVVLDVDAMHFVREVFQ